jgi:hypothetical protein
LLPLAVCVELLLVLLVLVSVAASAVSRAGVEEDGGGVAVVVLFAASVVLPVPGGEGDVERGPDALPLLLSRLAGPPSM